MAEVSSAIFGQKHKEIMAVCAAVPSFIPYFQLIWSCSRFRKIHREKAYNYLLLVLLDLYYLYVVVFHR